MSYYSIWNAKEDLSVWGKAYTYHRARQNRLSVFKSLWLIWVASHMLSREQAPFRSLAR